VTTSSTTPGWLSPLPGNNNNIDYLITGYLPPPTRRRLCDRSVCHWTSTKLARHGQGGDPLEVVTFGGDPDLRVDSGSHFYFLYHCTTGDFWIFVSISHTINGLFVPYLVK